LGTLDSLIGRRIVEVAFIHEYIQLWLDDQSVLNVYNRWKIVGRSHIGNLVSCVIVSIEEAAATLKISVSPEAALIVGLADSDLSGPEALQYTPKVGPMVVWNSHC